MILQISALYLAKFYKNLYENQFSLKNFQAETSIMPVFNNHHSVPHTQVQNPVDFNSRLADMAIIFNPRSPYNSRLEPLNANPKNPKFTQTLLKSQTGTIALVSKTYCLIDYNLPEPYLNAPNIKTTRPGKLFFYQLDFYGNHLSLKVGDLVEFDVVKNNDSGIYVGYNVHAI